MSSLPSYVAEAKPVPWANRAPWYKTIAPTYAGIMLWFVFWQDLSKTGTPGGIITAGIGPAFLGLIIAAVICHFLFYMAPAMLGAKTGLPLYVVGTSTYGVTGGLLMPGFLMGILQFGWLGVNAWGTASILCTCFNIGMTKGPTGADVVQIPGMAYGVIATVWAVGAAFVGLKGIQYVARIATYLPLIPVVVILIMLAVTFPGLRTFKLEKMVEVPQATAVEAQQPANAEAAVAEQPDPWGKILGKWGVISYLCTYIIGFFATAGAAGADIAMGSRNEEDVHIGGLAGLVLPTVLTGEAVILIVVGAYGCENMIQPANLGVLNPVALMPDILGKTFANIAMIGLAISAFPGACFSALIAANSFKTTMPKVNPFISVGIGTLVSVFLAISGTAGDVVGVFVVIGASFGPICGAILADFLLAGRKWSGPRAGFNPAGWLSWFFGFLVGSFNLFVSTALARKWEFVLSAFPNLQEWENYVPVPPMSAFIVGFVLYLVLSVVGLRTRKLEMPPAAL